MPDIEKRHTKHLAHGRAVDEDNPLPPTQKPRGYGGVALIYNRDLNMGIKKLQLGSNRIVAIEVCSVPPLCICNVYMPSRNSKSNCNDKENYMHCLDQLEEILNIYTRSHAVFILGDMNASLVPRRGNQQDVLLRDFVDSNSLCWRQNGEETFFHPNKGDRAEIDYVLFNIIGDSLVKSVSVERNIPLNTSDHVPVFAQLSVEVGRKERAETTTVQLKPKWDGCDKRIYKSSIRQNLKQFESFIPSLTEEIDILQPLAHLNAVLKQATRDSIPNHKTSLKIKGRRRCWTQKMKDAMKNSRLMWWEWRKAGEPEDLRDPTRQRMLEARVTLRKVQRLEAAIHRNDRVEDIMTSDNSSKTFFRLINRQRKSSNAQLQTLIIDGKACETDDEIRAGWATHFQRLAAPMENDRFDSEYKEMVDLDVMAIAATCETEGRPIPPVQLKEVHAAMKRLKNNKAADIMGLTSEHFKMGGCDLTEFLTSFLNYIISTKKVSAVLKEGILTPIFKKGDTSDPGNYRGITVTPVLLKILEHILNARHNEIFISTQSRLQRGFTEGCSSLNAAVILTECVLEASHNKQDLWVTTLDTQKAFDVVDHGSLLRRLYLDGIEGDDWLLVRDMYSDCSSRIKWAGGISHPINITQGVRQGGVLSTGHYKRYDNPILLHLEQRYTGAKIGSIGIPHVTVADDVALLSWFRSEMQVMVWDVEDNAGRERFIVNPSKSHALKYLSNKRKENDEDIFMYNKKIKDSKSATHLGIVRNVNGKPDIEQKINLGRKTAYSLMGAGFHGGGGLKPSQNGYIWSTFVVPRLLYGLESILLSKKDVECLEKFQRKCLKQIQGLPDKTANSISLALLGVLPLDVVVHKNALTTFLNMIRLKGSIENDIALRQIVMKDVKDKSWFMFVREILHMYDLPSIFQLLSNPPSKNEWKRVMNTAVNKAVEEGWQQDVKSKSSLKYVNVDSLKVGRTHHIWSTVRNSIYDSRRAQLKSKLLTGTYILQGNRAVFNQFQVNPTCRLCKAEPETRQHFISECSFLNNERAAYSEKLLKNPVFQSAYIDRSLIKDPEFLTQLTLDASAVLDKEQFDKITWGLLELLTREYIHRIHHKRLAELKRLSS